MISDDHFWLVRIVMSKWAKDGQFHLLNDGSHSGSVKNVLCGGGNRTATLHGCARFSQWLSGLKNHQKKEGQNTDAGDSPSAVFLLLCFFWMLKGRAAKCDGLVAVGRC